MTVKECEIGTYSVPLLKPFKTALRTVESLEGIVVRITTDSGRVGYGETAPTEAITGEGRGSILSSLEILACAIITEMLHNKERLLSIIHGCIEGNFSAKSAIEIALYDLWAQEEGLPLYRYLGGEERHFKTGITISLNPIEVMVADAQRAIAEGFESLKIKLGAQPAEDLLRVQAIHVAVGSAVPLKLDANQGWSPKETVAFLAELEKRELEVQLIEQPVRRTDFEGLIYIKERSTIPVLADESAFSPEDVRALLQRQAVDMVNIKLDKCGGISRALEIADICREYDTVCMIGCMLEGSISVGAAAHMASARAETVTLYDLDAPILCGDSPVRGGAYFGGAEIRLSEKPGLGIEGVDGVEWHSYKGSSNNR